MSNALAYRPRAGAVLPWVGTVARWGLAAVWLVAGASKVGDLAASGRAVNAYRLLPYDAATVVGAALPFVELALGVLLLLGLATRLTAGVSVVLLVVFVAGIVSAWSRGLAIDCGCFGGGGDLGAGQDPGYGREILRDTGFLLLAGYLTVRPRTPVSVDRWLADADGPDDDDGAGEGDGETLVDGDERKARR